MCLSTTQLLVLLVACPPGPDPLTNCSSRSSSFKSGRSISRFLLATKTHGSPDGRGLSTWKTLDEPVNATRPVTLYKQLMKGRRRGILKLNTTNVVENINLQETSWHIKNCLKRHCFWISSVVQEHVGSFYDVMFVWTLIPVLHPSANQRSFPSSSCLE